ncbi:MAG: Gfo/Idh/MocA family oxidoreductase [Spirochaetes bacterium]|nr:Gfo/Idh/MocA family oxidoreductase [Spirochaetota bacterium]
MQKKADGQNYAPKGKVASVCSWGEFKVGIVGLDHGHIYGMCNGLQEAGAMMTMVWDPDPAKIAAFTAKFPGVKAAEDEAEILGDPSISLVAAAPVPCDRGALGLRVMDAGKDYFCDKPPLTTRADVGLARQGVARTGRKFAVYYSERLHVEASVFAEKLIAEGAIGKVIQVVGSGPHRISLPTRPAWFFDRRKYGGILVDLGCHQIEQILFFSGAGSAEITASRVHSYKYSQFPDFEDFGDASLVMDNGASGYFSVHWFTPDGLGAWGDGRTFIQGTEGYLELRKYIDVAADPEGDHVILVNHEGEYHHRVAGTCGFPFFGRLVRDCLDRTSTAFDQGLVFRAIELAIEAEEGALARGQGKMTP